MKLTLVALLFLSMFAARASAKALDPFSDPVSGFSDTLLPLLTSFEKASVETTLRGFIARGDTFPGYKQSNSDPSDTGLYLNVAVREEMKGVSDRTEQIGSYTRRNVSIPSGRKGVPGIEIELSYGPNIPKKPLEAVNACIDHLLKSVAKKPVHTALWVAAKRAGL